MVKKISILVLLLIMAGGMARAQSQSEANLKAVFMYNFTKFIEWENVGSERRFIIGIIGSSSIDKPIREIARTNSVNNKRIEIKHFSKPEDISNCHMLFIPRNSLYELPEILDKVNKGVLTVCEEPGSASLGASINFIIVNDKLKFEINQRSLYLAGLKASSQLLKLAVIVDR